jgi:chromosome partitioning protein
MAKIFCVANQKGGVGKTTTTVNLAAGLAKIGQRLLMIDLDPQGNATMGSGVDKRQLELTIYDVLLESATITEARVKSDKLIAAGCSYDVLGANRELAGAEVELVDVERRERRIKMAVAAVEAEYDFVLIDCPPSLSMLTLNGLCCANGVIVPMQCEYFALEGLTDLVNTIKQVHANLNPDLQIIGLLLQRDARVKHDAQQTDDLQVRVQIGVNLLDGVDQICQTFQREILALHGHNHAVSAAQAVQRQHGQAGRAVDQDKVVLVGHGGHGGLDAALAALDIDQLDLGTGQVAVGTQNIVTTTRRDQLLAFNAGFGNRGIF